jgi:trehalose 6-phosphate synthase
MYDAPKDSSGVITPIAPDLEGVALGERPVLRCVPDETEIRNDLAERAARPETADLVIVANRLPIRSTTNETGTAWTASPGGLVSALTPTLQADQGIWIGWPGGVGDDEPPEHYAGVSLRSISLTQDDYANFYLGFANATLWPLYHDAIRTPRFEREWWQGYVEVNDRFARAAASAAAPGATVWVHDYQLQLVPKMLRDLRPDLRIGFFLHIPFPPQELFLQLPWRREILEGLVGADLIGFQVPGAATNFARLARRVLGATGADGIIEYGGRRLKVGAFPISVDTDNLVQLASQPAVQARAQRIRSELGDPEFVMLGVDRLDYTKGIDQRINALAELYADGFLSPMKHVFVQVASPSRDDGPHYQRERHHLEQRVGEVNGEYGRVGHPAIHYLHQTLDAEELVSLYLAADIMLVTPLRDGMNLVAKEYVTCRTDSTGVLILSEFAGAAAELRDAVSVNPHDLDGIKAAVRYSVVVGPEEAQARMRRLRRVVKRHDVHFWATSFLDALSDLGDPPDGDGNGSA